MPENKPELPVTTVPFRLREASPKPPPPTTLTHINYLGGGIVEVSTVPIPPKKIPPKTSVATEPPAINSNKVKPHQNQGMGILDWFKKVLGLQKPTPPPQPSTDWDAILRQNLLDLQRVLREKDGVERQRQREQEATRKKQTETPSLI